ncbi:hypothetical protein EYF80_051127 [Liparis tanakae]|uniref:Uncharacterized protein n=1 Tax=Liparis tanakae TaxID=230148 RepID=A0A4Z2FE75_9TELE|nr:hypothetical protein EYF80_051127 [Liparis tanakae]
MCERLLVALRQQGAAGLLRSDSARHQRSRRLVGQKRPPDAPEGPEGAACEECQGNKPVVSAGRLRPEA